MAGEGDRGIEGGGGVSNSLDEGPEQVAQASVS